MNAYIAISAFIVGFSCGAVFVKLIFVKSDHKDTDRIDYLAATESALVVSSESSWAVVRDREVIGSPSNNIRFAIDNASEFESGRS